MFQYATLRALGIKKNVPIGFSNMPLKSFDGGDSVFAFNVQKNTCPSPPWSYYEEPHFHFDPFLTEVKDGTDILGYFQSWRYFDNIRSTLLEEFTPADWNVEDKIDFYRVHLGFNSSSPGVCAVHVRRGDYVQKQDYHPLCGMKYYKEAMEHPAVAHMQKVIVTDDKEWAKEAFPGFKISPMETNLEDLWFIASCEGVIMANSSFSWWGAYLGPNNNVIAPKNWFGDDKNTSDLYHPNWNVI